MDKEYLLLLRLNTARGEELVGKFFLGHDAEKAYALFKQLDGDQVPAPGHLIFFEFIEVADGLPVNLHLVACNLEQASCNFKTLVKELFKSSLV